MSEWIKFKTNFTEGTSLFTEESYIYVIQEESKTQLEGRVLDDYGDLLFSYSFCDRGVWDGRIIFPNDEEFDHEYMIILPRLWNELKTILIEHIKSNNPNRDYSSY